MADPVKFWYSQPIVKHLIRNFVSRTDGDNKVIRCCSFFVPKSLQKEHSIFRAEIYRSIVGTQGLDYFIESLKLVEKPYNFYAFTGWLKDFPILSMNKQLESAERQEITKDFDKYVVAYDFCLDFDIQDKDLSEEEFNKEFENVYKETALVKAFFDKHKVPYWIMFTGHKGFNIKIPSPYMPITEASKRYIYYKKIADSLIKKLDLKYVDTNVYDNKRVFKIPYSIERRRDLVVLPLDDDQFNNFEESLMNIFYVWKNVKLMDRGLLIRPGSGENVQKMLKEVGFDG